MQTFSVRQILDGKAPANQPVVAKGWVRTRRASKAGISFIALSDGSCFRPMQIVAPESLENYADEESRCYAFRTQRIQKINHSAVSCSSTFIPI